MKTEIKTKRLTLCPMSDAEIEALIERTPSDELRAAYGEMLSGGKSDPENRVWYAPWSMVLKDAQEYVGDLGFKGPVKKACCGDRVRCSAGVRGAGLYHRSGAGHDTMGVSAEGCGVCGNRNRPGEQGFAACSRKVRLCAGRNNEEEGPRFVLESPLSSQVSIYMLFGIAIGMSVGQMCGQMVWGLAPGISLGLLAGVLLDNAAKKKREELRQQRRSNV